MRLSCFQTKLNFGSATWIVNCNQVNDILLKLFIIFLTEFRIFSGFKYIFICYSSGLTSVTILEVLLFLIFISLCLKVFSFIIMIFCALDTTTKIYTFKNVYFMNLLPCMLTHMHNETISLEKKFIYFN